MYRAIIFIYVIFFAISCSNNEPDFVGTYEATSIRDECPDPDNNARVNADQNGICLQGSSSLECINIALDIEVGGTFIMTTQRSIEAFGSFIPSAPITQTGSYSTADNQIILSPTGSSSITLTTEDDGANLDWNVQTTSEGCDRLYQLRRQL